MGHFPESALIIEMPDFSDCNFVSFLHLETEKHFFFTNDILNVGLVKYQFVSLLCC